MQHNASFWISLNNFLKWADINDQTPTMIRDTYWRLRKVVDAEMAHISSEYDKLNTPKDGTGRKD